MIARNRALRVINFFTKIGVFCLAAILIITLGVVLFLSSDRGNKFLNSHVNKALGRAGGYSAEIEGIGIGFPLKIHIKSLRLFDNNGMWLAAKNNQVDLSLFALLEKRIVINNLTSDSLDLIRIPKAKEERAAGSDVDFPDIAIENISIERLSLRENVTGLEDSLSVGVEGNILLKERRFRFLLTGGKIEGLSNQTLKGIKIRVSGDYLMKDDVLVLQELSGESDILETKGETTIEFTRQKVEGRYSFLFKNPDKAGLVLDSKSELEGELTLAGSLPTPDISVDFTARNITYKTKPYPDLEGKIMVTSRGGLWSGAISAAVTQKNLSFHTNFTARREGIIDFTEALIEGEGLSIISKSLKYNPFGNSVDGKIDIKDTDLSRLSYFFSLPLSGRVEADIELASSGGRQECLVTGSIKKLNIKGKMIEEAHAKLNIRDVWKPHVEKASIELIKPYFAQNLWNSLKFEAKALDTKWQVTLAGTSAKKNHAFNISTILAAGFSQGKEFKGAISFLKGNYGADKITASRASTLEYERDKLLWDLAEIKIGDRGAIESRGALRGDNISGKITLSLPLDLPASAFLTVSHKLGGLLAANLSLKGALHDPLVQGGIEISNGKYTFYPLGVKLKNINGSLKAGGGSLSLDGFIAYDNQGNRLEVKGKLGLSLPYAFKFSAVTQDFNLLNHPNANGKVKADLTIRGDNRAAEISGTIEPHSFEINLPEQFSAKVPELNIVAIEPSENKGEEYFIKSDSDYSVSLNALITLGKQIFVRGWGLNAELGGSLKIKGTVGDPELKGKLYTIKGRYEEFGKQFQIKEGILTFEGTIPPSPYLHIKGASTVDSIEISPVLSGPLTSPSLSIESTPALPQEEALSRLLFGKEAKNISPFQAIRLADSLRRLGGYGKTGYDPLDSARNLLHVDDINIKAGSDTQEGSIGVGKYLTDKVYIGFERGMRSGVGRTNLEIELTPSILLESSMGGDGAGSVGINWKRDY